jgi:hypothetical protein
MRFDNFENDIASIEARDGYQLRFASGTSTFRGESTPVEMREGIWEDLNGENYRLLNNTLITIDTAARKQGILSNTLPRLHMELTLPEAWDERTYVVLILDNDRSALVDWAIASPELPSYFAQPDSNRATVYFDIPLVHVTRNENPFPDRANFLNRASQWENEPRLTFGIFIIEDKEVMQHTRRLVRNYVEATPFYNQYFRRDFMGMIDFIARKADIYLKKNTDGKETLQTIPASGVPREATSDELRSMNGKALLFCHGILSSTEGAFKGILDDSTFLPSLLGKYGNNIRAWDHYTLSKTTATNANNLLLEKLQGLHDVTLDIVCHSRGAGVIRNFVESPDNRRILTNQGIKINKVVFVAGACLGSQLAEARNTNRLFRRINMLIWFFGGAPSGFIKAILTVIKLLATIAQKMPGVESMNPVGNEIADLNKYENTLAAEYHYIRAHYDFRFLPAKILEEFLWDDGVFDGAANDLVVPYEGASPSKQYLNNYQAIMKDTYHYGDAQNPQPVVMHTNFFNQAQTKCVLGTLLP